MKNSELWASKFGDEYTKRQKEDLDNRAYLFSDALKMVFSDIDSVCEFGANVGENIKVLQTLFEFRTKWLKGKKMPTFSAIEINRNCCEKLSDIIGMEKIYFQSVEKPIKEKYDLVFTRGLLIHLDKKTLDSAIKNLYDSSNKYILICEYHSPERRMIPYRGNKDMLFTDDYFKPFLQLGCQIIDCGFDYKYHITWMLMEVNKCEPSAPTVQKSSRKDQKKIVK